MGVGWTAPCGPLQCGRIVKRRLFSLVRRASTRTTIAVRDRDVSVGRTVNMGVEAGFGAAVQRALVLLSAMSLGLVTGCEGPPPSGPDLTIWGPASTFES